MACSTNASKYLNYSKEIIAMATIQDLKKYIGYEFSSGCYTGEDYKSFQTKYITTFVLSANKTTGNL